MTSEDGYESYEPMHTVQDQTRDEIKRYGKYIEVKENENTDHNISFVLHNLEVPLGRQEDVEKSRAVKGRYGEKIEYCEIYVELCAHFKEYENELGNNKGTLCYHTADSDGVVYNELRKTMENDEAKSEEQVADRARDRGDRHTLSGLLEIADDDRYGLCPTVAENEHAYKSEWINMLDRIERKSAEIVRRAVAELHSRPTVRTFVNGQREKDDGQREGKRYQIPLHPVHSVGYKISEHFNLLLRGDREEELPELFLSFSRLSREGNDLNSLGNVLVIVKKLESLCAVGFVGFVCLGGDDDEGDLHLREIVYHHQVVLRGTYLEVNELNRELEAVEVGVVGEESVGQRAPTLFLAFGALRESVAGKVDEHNFIVYIVEVDRDGLTGSRADARKRLSAEHGVDQRALADVRSTRENYLRDSLAGELIDSSCSDLKIGILNINCHVLFLL